MSIRSIDNLQSYVERVSLEDFERPFKHKAVWNPRLRTTGGRYLTREHHLEFNQKIYNAYGEVTFRGIVRHELCHYHLHLMGLGYRHRDKAFKQLLREVGGSRFAPSLPYRGKWYIYQCQTCRKYYRRQRRLDVSRYVCRDCYGKLRCIKEADVTSDEEQR